MAFKLNTPFKHLKSKGFLDAFKLNAKFRRVSTIVVLSTIICSSIYNWRG